MTGLQHDRLNANVVTKGVRRLARMGLYAAITTLLGISLMQDANCDEVQLTVVDPKESNAFQVQTTSEDFRQRIAIQIEKPKPGAELQIEAVSLLGPDGVSADLSITAQGRSGKLIKVTPSTESGTLDVIDLDLGANLQRLGEYSGYITLRYGDAKPVVRPIRVTRTMIDVPIEAIGVERIPNLYCLKCWREAKVWLTLQAPPDRDLTVVPTVTRLALNRTGNEQIQAIVSRQSISVGGADAESGFSLKPGETKRMAIDLSGFSETGEYVGKVRLAAAGFKPKDYDLKLLVKDPWWLAAVLITLGAGVSLLLRRYGSDKRPRLVVRQRIAQIGEQIDALRRATPQIDEAESRVLDAIGDRLIKLHNEATRLDKLSDTWSTTAKQTLDSVAAKLPQFTRWVNARRLRASLDSSIDTKEIQNKLLGIQTALSADADVTDAQKAELEQLPAEIARLRRDAMLAALDALQKEFDELGKIALPAAPGWDHVNVKLTQARDYARTDDFDAARVAYEVARKVLANLLLDELADRVAAGTPLGLEAKQWTDLKPKVEVLLERGKAATDAQAALDGYSQAYGAYLNAQIGALLPKLDDVAIKAKAQKLMQDQQQSFLDLAKNAATKLREAAALLKLSKPQAAYTKHLEALANWQSLNDLLPGGDKMGGGAAGAVGTAQVAPGAELPPGAGHKPVLIPTAVGRVAESATELWERTKQLDVAVDLLAIVLAAVLGVQFVWGPNPTWGGLSDWLFALLWGLGLHQVSGYTFDGILGLREKLLK
jgi:hypothetical protein